MAYDLSLKRCSRCVLSEGFPGITFDGDDICNFCRADEALPSIETRKRELKDRLEELFVSLDRSGDYDCIVALSGGKDSSYTLYMMSKIFNLRCLAVTIDNSFLSSQAVRNCHAVCDGLGVDHILFKPPFSFMKDLYVKSVRSDNLHVKAAVTRASAICNSCIGLINNHMIKLALMNRVPVIAGGYLGGQVPKSAGMLRLDPKFLLQTRRNTVRHYVDVIGPEAKRYFDLPDPDQNTKPITVINPLLAFTYSESEIVEKIRKYGWSRPNDTGTTSSNCRLNDVGVAFHLQKHGFHPYEAEFAELVRHGYMSRDEALIKLTTAPNVQSTREIAGTLGLDELR